MTTTISASAYLNAVTAAIGRVTETQHDAVHAAADLIATALGQGGVVQAFGCGHSEALSMEIAGRAGGLVPTNRIALRDLVLYGGADREVLEIKQRDQAAHWPATAHGPDDVFVLTSNSGVNGVIVEFALLLRDRGHRLIGITSLDHTARVESRHPSGRRLADIADVVLDNGAPYGDAALPLPGGGAVGAISSITGALLAQQIVTEVVARLLAAGQAPPVYLSANVPGGDTHNNELEARYAGRIRRTA
ncbi:sugar isomerase domain-containing protein [Plantactinospora sp. CA-290183]|uniref:sugar isomerase domain-containing protein n=1 Tax=Plantactinospora sp. CA-290183 TaxID=3240006 RepID=UPI003D8DC588